MSNKVSGVKYLKSLRRGIMVICSLLLIPLIITGFPKGKYFNDELKTLVKNGKAEVIEVNKKIPIDNDTIYIERIINTDTQTILRYKIVEEPGWSFPSNVLLLYADAGNKHQGGGSSSGKFWGEDGIINYERISKATKEITIRLEWYDRVGEVVIPVDKGGSK
ncbi:hypothetical protein [Candidatus Clostridium stratigraminis]|uniref:hypothetical protein n=1 Tax=Candidatus Clostridium stratigraminis TaxID=3381661 RepID=UPI0038781A29